MSPIPFGFLYPTPAPLKSLFKILRKIFFHAATADLISAAQFACGFTNRGVNHGNAPIKSGVTRICPSQSGPLPMPMVRNGNLLR